MPTLVLSPSTNHSNQNWRIRSALVWSMLPRG